MKADRDYLCGCRGSMCSYQYSEDVFGSMSASQGRLEVCESTVVLFVVRGCWKIGGADRILVQEKGPLQLARIRIERWSLTC